METNISQNVGVDICKATLDVHLYPAGVARQFANNAKGFKALLDWLGDRCIARVVFEPTGRYHHDFERRLSSAGLSLAKVNLSIGVQTGPTLRAYRRAKGDHFRRGGEACASIKMRSACRARGGGRA